MNGLALCAGAGGLELGLHIALPGYRTVGYVEREAYAAATLVARMEDATLDRAPVWDDLDTFDGRRWRGCVDIVTAGYPCPGESDAGRRLGTADPRWKWPQVRRIFVQSGAEWGFFENVGAHLSRSFPVVRAQLERLGCRVAAGLFTSKEAGRNHERERLFILAHRPGGRLPGIGLSAGQRQEGCGAPDAVGVGHHVADTFGEAGRREARVPLPRGSVRTAEIGTAESGRCDFGMANAIGNGWGPGRENHREHDRAIPAAGGQYAVDLAHPGRTGLARAEQPGQPGQAQRGFDAGATASELRGALPLCAPGPADPRWPDILRGDASLEPAICRMADGMAHRVDRLRLTGNGVDPLAAAFAFRTLRDALAWQDGRFAAAQAVVGRGAA